MATKEGHILLITMSVLLLSGALAWWRLRPPAPLGADAPAEVFSAGRALGELQAVVGDVPHPVGSPANTAVRERIVARLRALGYAPNVHRGFACDAGRCAVVHNVVAELSGSQNRDAIVLLAHYDSVPAAPGAADDGAGVAALLEIARALREAPARNAVLFLFTDGEEYGLLGAHAFVKESLADRVRFVINLEARGSGGSSLMFETSGPTAPIAALLAQEVSRPVTSSLFAAVYGLVDNRTELEVFRARGIGGLSFAFIENLTHYHTPLDDRAHLSEGSVQHHGDNVLALVVALGAVDLERMTATEDEAVWFDVLAVVVARWPTSWSLPLALAALALIAVFTTLRAREGGSLKTWLACLGLPLVAMLLGAVIGMLAVATLSPEGRPTEEWGAASTAARVALWVGAIAPCVAWSWIAGRRIDPWMHFAGVWSLWAILAALTARFAPYASYLFVPPAILAGILAVATRAHRREPDSAWFLVVTLAPVFVAASMWFTLAFGLTHALGPVGHFAISAAVALPVVAALPALARFEPRFRYPLGALAAAVAVPLVVAALSPDFDAERPQRLSIVHFQHDDAAEWWLNATWGPIPVALRDAAAAGAAGPPPLPLKETVAVARATAPLVDAKGPALELSNERSASARHPVRARMRSHRGAYVMGLLVPPEARLVGMRTEETPLQPITIRDGPYTGHAVVFIAGVPPEGLEVTFVFATAAPRLIVFDLVHQLPDGAEPLRAARGATGIPSQEGDLSIVAATVELSAR